VDIVQAGAVIDRAKSDIDALRQDIDDTNHDWYSAAADLAEKSGTEGPCMPRICGRQTLKDNVTADTPESYFKRSLTIPFLDHLSAEIETRFSDTAKKAANGLNLIPTVMKLKTQCDGETAILESASIYSLTYLAHPHLVQK